ncbi:MAG: metal ABC transporter permease [Clostridia bacterium]|nr:metal ABC transporter permease [Clostridia bacterium]
MSALLGLLSQKFILRAMLVGVLVSLCASLLGVSLVLKRYSMIGDGLSHVGFASLAISMALGWAPLLVSIPVVVISAFFLLRINNQSNDSAIKGDSAIALISSSALALGIMITSLTKGMNSDVISYMFGSILTLSQSDVIVSIVLSLIVLVLFIVFYNKIFTVTFDENFAKATGTNVSLLNSLLAILTSITIVIGMRIMGTLLISSLIIFPSLSSMRIFKKFKHVVISSSIISVFCFLLGLILSCLIEIPTGASIVVTNLTVFIICHIIGKTIK